MGRRSIVKIYIVSKLIINLIYIVVSKPVYMSKYMNNNNTFGKRGM